MHTEVVNLLIMSWIGGGRQLTPVREISVQPLQQRMMIADRRPLIVLSGQTCPVRICPLFAALRMFVLWHRSQQVVLNYFVMCSVRPCCLAHQHPIRSEDAVLARDLDRCTVAIPILMLSNHWPLLIAASHLADREASQPLPPACRSFTESPVAVNWGVREQAFLMKFIFSAGSPDSRTHGADWRVRREISYILFIIFPNFSPLLEQRYSIAWRAVRWNIEAYLRCRKTLTSIKKIYLQHPDILDLLIIRYSFLVSRDFLT